jgi:predicted nucleic acid-binding protein
LTAYLVDTSVLSRVGRSSAVAERVAELRRSGSLWTCDLVSLEVGYSARNSAEWRAVNDAQTELPQAPVTAETLTRAVEVQGALASRGHHRVAVPDLIIAAAAEQASVAVLHYDHDFETIAQATRQPVEWVTRPGSID